MAYRPYLGFSRVELLHILAGIVVFIMVELGLANLLALPRLIRREPLVILILILGTSLSFLAHELAHKVTAIRFGYWSEFRISPLGLVLSLASIPLPVRIIAPGAVVVRGYMLSRRHYGLIALAGPAANLALAVILAPLAAASPLLAMLMRFNADLALFNLLPVAPLDGSKVVTWDERVWLAAFALALLLVWLTG